MFSMIKQGGVDMGAKGIMISIFCFVFLFYSAAYAQDQEITLTTYYPAPYGDYDMLILAPRNGPSVDPAPNGAMYFDDGSNAARERGMYIYDSDDGGWRHARQRFGVPSGTIVMWSGSIASIPSGWALCDGQTVSGTATPDLRNRFIVGAGNSYGVGATGGADQITLTAQQMPRHTHTGSTNTAGSHKHSYRVSYGTTTRTGSSGPQVRTALTHNQTTGSAGSHSHTISLNNTGGNQPHENRPPYYALCYIIKL
jgi:microcystin-dependent protein